METSIEHVCPCALHAVIPVRVVQKALRVRGGLRLSIYPAHPERSKWPQLERGEFDIDDDADVWESEEPVVCLLIADTEEVSTIRWIGHTSQVAMRAEAFSWLDAIGIRPLTHPIRLTSPPRASVNHVQNVRPPYTFSVIDLPEDIAAEIRRSPLTDEYFPVEEIQAALQKLWPQMEERCRVLLRYIANPPEPLTLEYARSIGYRTEKSVHGDLERARDRLAALVGNVSFTDDFLFNRGSENGYEMDQYTRQAMLNLGLISSPIESAAKDGLPQNGKEQITTGSPATFGPTTTLTTAFARIGQSDFRQDLLDYWNGCCAVTACDVAAALIASHVVPWEASDDRERRDPYNGLLLVANMDKLFDAALITFDDLGSIRISPEIPQSEWKTLGLSATLRLRRIDTRHLPYMRRHRTRFEQQLKGCVSAAEPAIRQQAFVKDERSAYSES